MQTCNTIPNLYLLYLSFLKYIWGGNFFSVPVTPSNRRDQFQAKTATQFFFSNTTRYLSKKKCRECINKEARQQIRTFLFCAYKKSWPRQTGLERPAESNTRGNWTMRIDGSKGFGTTYGIFDTTSATAAIRIVSLWSAQYRNMYQKTKK